MMHFGTNRFLHDNQSSFCSHFYGLNVNPQNTAGGSNYIISDFKIFVENGHWLKSLRVEREEQTRNTHSE